MVIWCKGVLVQALILRDTQNWNEGTYGCLHAMYVSYCDDGNQMRMLDVS